MQVIMVIKSRMKTAEQQNIFMFFALVNIQSNILWVRTVVTSNSEFDIFSKTGFSFREHFTAPAMLVFLDSSASVSFMVMNKLSAVTFLRLFSYRHQSQYCKFDNDYFFRDTGIHFTDILNQHLQTTKTGQRIYPVCQSQLSKHQLSKPTLSLHRRQLFIYTYVRPWCIVSLAVFHRMIPCILNQCKFVCLQMI